MDILEATRRYELWLAARLPLISRDLRRKHDQMADSPFAMLRATFYRWIQIFPEVCPSLAAAPRLPVVGDLHAENFGTWRDRETRLVWGVNDFDEVCRLPYVNDLVRLGASFHLLIEETDAALRPGEACDAALEGYTASLKQGGEPIVLSDRHGWLRRIALRRLAKQRGYWNRIDKLPALPPDAAPPRVRRLIEDALPERGLPLRFVHRQAGLGSLGRQRFLGLTDWHGARVAREAKAFTTSAALWLRRGPIEANASVANELLRRAVRSRDHFFSIHDDWTVRRLGSDCSRIELVELGPRQIEAKLAWMMGWETGNIHLANPRAIHSVLADLKKRRGRWLRNASKNMAAATQKDWRVWRKSRPAGH
jgi:Uncharacterized protein conserved in bacteria (DUF2252)